MCYVSVLNSCHKPPFPKFCTYLPLSFTWLQTPPFTSMAALRLIKTKACVPPNDFPTDHKIGRLFKTKKIGRFYHRFFFKISVSFVCVNRWEPTDFGVTPKDLPTDKKYKIGGCLYYSKYQNVYILVSKL